MMNQTDLTAIVAVAPGADHYGLVTWRGEPRRCYFHPDYWSATATLAGWGAATVGARVAVLPDPRAGLTALNRVGNGAPTYVYAGGQRP